MRRDNTEDRKRTIEESPSKDAAKALRALATTATVLSVLGLADSIWLTISHYTTTAILACPETAFINCQKVTTSVYSQILGIPISLFGILFFLLMIFLQLPKAWANSNIKLFIFRLVASSLSLIAAFALVYIEFYKIGSICIYCTGVHILTFLVFCLTIIASSLKWQQLKGN